MDPRPYTYEYRKPRLNNPTQYIYIIIQVIPSISTIVFTTYHHSQLLEDLLNLKELIRYITLPKEHNFITKCPHPKDKINFTRRSTKDLRKSIIIMNLNMKPFLILRNQSVPLRDNFPIMVKNQRIITSRLEMNRQKLTILNLIKQEVISRKILTSRTRVNRVEVFQ